MKHKGMKKQQTRTEKKPSKHDIRQSSEARAGHQSKVFLNKKPTETTNDSSSPWPPKGSYYSA